MMKKAVLMLVALALFSCGKDNSSTVNIQVDGNACFVSAADFDERSESTTGGLRTVVYVWDCADYVSPLSGMEYQEKRVSLIFTETACLQLQAELVLEGLCVGGKIPMVQ